MLIDAAQLRATTVRYEERTQIRNQHLKDIKSRRFLKSDDPKLVKAFLSARFGSQEAERLMRRSEQPLRTAEAAPGDDGAFALERVLGTSDLMGVAWLERGLQASRSIGRVWINVSVGQPEGYGTGFLISPRLLLTNNHVLKSPDIAARSWVEFDYQIGLNNALLPTKQFTFVPDDFFVTDSHLDFTLVAVESISLDGRTSLNYGWNALVEQPGKAIIGQWMNIVQHPNGEPKQLVLRENQLIDRLDEFLHYQSDTSPGSSGSPVFNDRWEVVALHHSGVYDQNDAGQPLNLDGGVWREEEGQQRIKWLANEGARVSSICAYLRSQRLEGSQKQLFEQIFVPAPATETLSKGQNFSNSAAISHPQVKIVEDGTVTWTLPLSVSVRLGEVAIPIPPTPASPAPILIQPIDPGNLQAVIEAARTELTKNRSDVLSVEAGYLFKDGWITKERAIVVTVRRKQSLAALDEANITPLPESFKGWPIEVVNPSIRELVHFSRAGRSGETFLPLEALGEEITYFPPQNISLDRIEQKMRVVAHVSPEAGWEKLSEFLAAVRQELVVGMYDFGAKHILKAITNAGEKPSFKSMTLVIQPSESVGSGTKANDLKDAEVVDELHKSLKQKFAQAWVKIGQRLGWVATSYHIKVAVRDQEAFWLSSGNWQSSNQPEAFPLQDVSPDRTWLDQYNREWHAIVEHPGLAKVLRTYLLHDYTNNQANNPANDPASNQDTQFKETTSLPDLFVPQNILLPEEREASRPFKYFPVFDQERVFAVKPLLTPDNYLENVIELIESAKNELLIQNQTFNAPKEGQDGLTRLLKAVLKKQAVGVDVKVIFRIINSMDVRDNLSALQSFGFDMRAFKVQKNCHTKGIVVDRKRVLLGSQNLSNLGVSLNRDASLLFDDEELAKYFAQIFDHDWANLAVQNIGRSSLPVELAPAQGETPEGMVRLDWKEYLEML